MMAAARSIAETEKLIERKPLAAPSRARADGSMMATGRKTTAKQARRKLNRCKTCGREWGPHTKDRWPEAPFDVVKALNILLELEHANHTDKARETAARTARLALFDAAAPSSATLGACEQTLRDGGFTEREIAAMNLDSGTLKESAARVAKRSAFHEKLAHARQSLEHAETLYLLSEAPARRAALDTIKSALLAMLGERGNPDSLRELRDILVHGNDREPGCDADLRLLLALVKERVPWLRRHGMSAAQVEARGLRNNLLSRFGDAFARLTDEVCADVLSRYVPTRRAGAGRPAGRGLTLNGVAAELVLRAGAWGYRSGTDRDGNRLRKDLDKAQRRGGGNA
jgi:hypothetical protein